MSNIKAFKSKIGWIYTVLTIAFLSLGWSAKAQDVAAGENVFKTNCLACHKMSAQRMVGPGLEGIMDRVPSEEWLMNWIKNSQALVQAGDEYAVKVFDEYKIPMTSYDFLPEEDLKNLVAYLVNPDAAVAEVPKEEASTETASASTGGLDGESLFKANCAACHKTSGAKLVGPGLEGIMNRVPSKEWLYKWVKNSSDLIASGDEYANEVFEANGKVTMTPFEALSNEEIDAIFDYIQNPPVKQSATADSGSGGSGSAAGNDNTVLWMLILTIILITVISVLVKAQQNLKNELRNRKGLEALPELTYWTSLTSLMSGNKTIIAVTLLIGAIVGANQGMVWLNHNIGVYQGYAPEQPIKFSHKIHAGQNGIDCTYCHNSAEKGKTSAIPSVNVCMNCHKAVSEGRQTGTTEINKIYEAAGWNPETAQYDKPEKPIEWIKIHNLPDFVYYNHSQHVVVGKQKCQTCHGPVETMDYPMKQYSDLTMRWCIDCHRETNVAMEGNAYYDKMHAELKEKYAAEGKTKFTVADIGGLECAKCHY